MDVPGGKATIVNVPFYDGDEFTGVVEFIYESALGCGVPRSAGTGLHTV